AIDHASGKYLFFMDSDDEITEDAIEKLYRAMQETPVDVTAGSVEKRERNGNVRMRRIYPDETVAGMLAMGYKHYSSRNRETVVWNKLYLLSFLKKHNIKCIDNQLYEDAVFTCQVVLNASSYKYIPDITYIHYDTDNSGMDRVRTKRVSLRASKEYLEIINFTKKYLDHYTDMRLRELVFRSLIFTIVLSVALVSDSVLLSRKEKRYFCRQCLVFPVSLAEAKRFEHRRFFLFMYVMFHLPLKTLFCKTVHSIGSRRKRNVAAS
ncbi:MAG: glycosyltransferase, partial [Bacteroidales bacterium]|nr:glycosyltransferase [Bacteroidales bacterium]